jgi:hypothetical protein
MSKPMYFITDGQLYVHYNAELDSYIADEGRIGACLFDKQNADGVLSTHLAKGGEHGDWYKVKVVEIKNIKHQRVQDLTPQEFNQSPEKVKRAFVSCIKPTGE